MIVVTFILGVEIAVLVTLKAGFHFSEFGHANRYDRIEKKQSDWVSLILVAKKLNLIQLPELTARSHALIANRLVARPNSEPANRLICARIGEKRNKRGVPNSPK